MDEGNNILSFTPEVAKNSFDNIYKSFKSELLKLFL